MVFVDRLKTLKALRLLYWLVRIGMGVTFVLSGIRKLPGIHFTALPVDNPVGHFFDAMYQTGFYWNFIGYFQILVGEHFFCLHRLAYERDAGDHLRHAAGQYLFAALALQELSKPLA